MNKNKIAVLLGGVCLVLTIAICVQIKTIGNANKNVSSSFAEDKLRDEVLKWQENYNKKIEELEQTEKLLENVRAEAAKNDEGAVQTKEQLNIANRLLGLTDLKGKGVIIVLDDNKAQASEVQDRWFYMGICYS